MSECDGGMKWSLTHAFGLLTFDDGQAIPQPRGAALAAENCRSVHDGTYLKNEHGYLGTWSQPLGVAALQMHVAVRGKEVRVGEAGMQVVARNWKFGQLKSDDISPLPPHRMLQFLGLQDLDVMTASRL